MKPRRIQILIQDGVPTAALDRIGRYATERTAGPNLVDAAHPPLVNPPAGGATQPETPPAKSGPTVDGGRDEDKNDDLKRTDDNKRNNDRSSGGGNIMCRQDTFRGTVFFVADGEGEVVLGGHGREGSGRGQDRGGLGGGGSSTESLLAASAFGNRRALQNRRKRRRRPQGKGVTNGGGNDSPGGGCCGFSLRNTSRDASNSSAGSGGGSGGSGPGENEGQILGDQLQVHGPPADSTGTAAATGTETEGVTAAASATGPQRRETAKRTDAEATTEDRGTDLTQSSLQVRRRAPGQSTLTPAPAPASPPAGVSFSLPGGEREGWQSGDSDEEWWPRPEVSAGFLKRGDFFGVDPLSASTAAAAERQARFS